MTAIVTAVVIAVIVGTIPSKYRAVPRRRMAGAVIAAIVVAIKVGAVVSGERARLDRGHWRVGWDKAHTLRRASALDAVSRGGDDCRQEEGT